MSNAVNTIYHKFNEHLLGMRNHYRPRNKKYSPLGIKSYIREHIRNGYQYEAKNIGIYTIQLKSGLYVIIFHDGKPFDSKDQIYNSLHPGVSVGEKGYQGSGGCCSSMLLTLRNGSVEHVILSDVNGSFTGGSMTIDGNCSCVVGTSSDFIEEIEKALVGSPFEVNVCYVTKVEKIGKYPPISFENMSQLGQFAPEVVENVKIHYGHMTILEPSMKNPASGHYKNLSDARKTTKDVGGKYSYNEVITYSEFMNHFCPSDCRYKYLFNDIKVRINADYLIKVSGSLSAEVYPGLCKNRQTEIGLIPLDGKSTSGSYTNPPNKLNTILKISGFKDDSRFKSDPLYMSDLNITLASRLNLPLMRSNVYNDLKDFPEFAYIEEANKNEKGSTYRIPFVNFEFDITSIDVIDNNGEFQKVEEPEIRSMLGDLDVFFNIEKTDVLRKVILDISSETLKQNDLSQLRETIKKYFPYSVDDMCTLPVEPDLGLESVEFIPSQGGRPIPGMTYQGSLQFKNTGMPVNPTSKVEVPGEGIECIYLKGKCVWQLDIDHLHVKSNNVWRTATLEEYEKACIRERKPFSRNYIIIDGVLYKFINFNLKSSVKQPNGKIKSKVGNDVSEENPHENNSMFKSLGENPDYYLRYEDGQLILNKDNAFISTYFRSIPEHKKWQEELWKELLSICSMWEIKFKNKTNSIKMNDDGYEILDNFTSDEEDLDSLSFIYNLNLYASVRINSLDIQNRLNKIQASIQVVE